MLRAEPQPARPALRPSRPPPQFGVVPITHMRGFQKSGKLPEDLVVDIQSRH